MHAATRGLMTCILCWSTASLGERIATPGFNPAAVRHLRTPKPPLDFPELP